MIPIIDTETYLCVNTEICTLDVRNKLCGDVSYDELGYIQCKGLGKIKTFSIYDHNSFIIVNFRDEVYLLSLGYHDEKLEMLNYKAPNDIVNIFCFIVNLPLSHKWKRLIFFLNSKGEVLVYNRKKYINTVCEKIISISRVDFGYRTCEDYSGTVSDQGSGCVVVDDKGLLYKLEYDKKEKKIFEQSRHDSDIIVGEKCVKYKRKDNRCLLLTDKNNLYECKISDDGILYSCDLISKDIIDIILTGALWMLLVLAADGNLYCYSKCVIDIGDDGLPIFDKRTRALINPEGIKFVKFSDGFCSSRGSHLMIDTDDNIWEYNLEINEDGWIDNFTKSTKPSCMLAGDSAKIRSRTKKANP